MTGRYEMESTGFLHSLNKEQSKLEREIAFLQDVANFHSSENTKRDCLKGRRTCKIASNRKSSKNTDLLALFLNL